MRIIAGLLHRLLLAAFLPTLVSGYFSVKDSVITQEDGTPFDFQCVNWPGHMETNLPEGLQHQSVDTIVGLIKHSGTYNCVRLTYAVETLSKLDMTARESLTFNSATIDTQPHIENFALHNPSLIDAKVGDVFKAVANALSSNGIKILMSNHVSKATWCCGDDDGNGWFGDEWFDVDMWLQSLTNIGLFLKDIPGVVALDLRNELRTIKKDEAEQTADWMKYMPMGIDAVLAGNPELLVFVSGLRYDNDWTFLDRANATQTVSWNNALIEHKDKLVFESHIYSWAPYGTYVDSCSDLSFDYSLGWSYKNGYPMVLTEIGTTVTTFNEPNHDMGWIDCVRDFILENKLGYGMWLLGGDYYVRGGEINYPDCFGLLNDDWSDYKNMEIVAKNKEMGWQ